MNFHKRHTIVISKEHSFGYHYHFRIDQFIDVQNLNSNYVRMAAGFVVTTMVALAARTAVELLVCLRRNHRDPQHHRRDHRQLNHRHRRLHHHHHQICRHCNLYFFQR